MAINNKYEFKKSVLDALGSDGYSEADVKNEETFRSKVLDALGVEHDYNDVNQTALWREKLVEGLGSGGGGGGSSDFSTAVMTVIADRTEIYAPIISEIGGHEWLSAEPIYSSDTFNVVLYKGECSAYVRQDGDLPNITVTGNAEVDENVIIITGDCTITIG